MLIGPRRRRRGFVRPSLGAMLAAAILVVLAALPAIASSGPTRLSNASVTPRTGTIATTFVFSVEYRNREGSPPDHVSVVVDGTSHPMTPGTTDWKHGVTFTWSTKLALGSHTVSFTSLDRDKFADSAAGGTITVVAPPRPSPEPTPNPTARPTPTPKPTPLPTAAPTPKPDPTTEAVSRPTPDQPPRASTSAPVPTVEMTPSAEPTPMTSVPAASPPAASPPGGGARDGGPGPIGGTASGGGGSGDVGGRSAGEAGPDAPDSSRRSWAELSAYLRLLDAGTVPRLQLVPALVASVGGVTMMMAFLFFGKKRRDGEQPAPDEVLAAKAGRGAGVAASAALVAEPRAGVALPDPDAELPRWRRPSLLEARKADPTRTVTATAAPLSFERGLVPPVEGRERRMIRYATVRLLDAPDELRSAAIGSLGQGDEVQLIERSGTYWLVLCPDGRQGWLHKMTLGEVVGETPSPTASQTWATSSIAVPDAVDEDVLEAFLAARGQS